MLIELMFNVFPFVAASSVVNLKVQFHTIGPRLSAIAS